MATLALAYFLRLINYMISILSLLGANGVLRAAIVGEPLVFALQKILGPTRPKTDPINGSAWHPFGRFDEEVGASGHAFIGAVPFLTAAELSDNQLLKYSLYLLSITPGLSRINDDMHYSSQVILGYAIAVLSVKSVMQTNESKLTIMPAYNRKTNAYGLQFLFNF